MNECWRRVEQTSYEGKPREGRYAAEDSAVAERAEGSSGKVSFRGARFCFWERVERAGTLCVKRRCADVGDPGGAAAGWEGANAGEVVEVRGLGEEGGDGGRQLEELLAGASER